MMIAFIIVAITMGLLLIAEVPCAAPAIIAIAVGAVLGYVIVIHLFRVMDRVRDKTIKRDYTLTIDQYKNDRQRALAESLEGVLQEMNERLGNGGTHR